MLVNMWSNRTSRSLGMGMQNGTATLQDSLAVFLKRKQSYHLPKTLEI